MYFNSNNCLFLPTCNNYNTSITTASSTTESSGDDSPESNLKLFRAICCNYL